MYRVPFASFVDPDLTISWVGGGGVAGGVCSFAICCFCCLYLNFCFFF